MYICSWAERLFAFLINLEILYFLSSAALTQPMDLLGEHLLTFGRSQKNYCYCSTGFYSDVETVVFFFFFFFVFTELSRDPKIDDCYV